MPVHVFGNVYLNHDAAAAAAKRRGIRKPDAYVATVERAEEGKGKKPKKKGK